MTSTSMKKMQGLGLPPLCHEGKDSHTDELEEVTEQFDGGFLVTQGLHNLQSRKCKPEI